MARSVRVSPGVAGKHAANPYLETIYSRISPLGFQPLAWSESTNLAYFDIVHVHWPQLLLGSKPGGLSRLRGLSWLYYLKIMKARGSKIVWTAHNLRPHSVAMSNQEWDEFFARFLVEMDAIVHLTSASMEMLGTIYSVPPKCQQVVIRHPHYADFFSPTEPKAATSPLKSLLVLGRVLPYKQLPEAIRAVSDLREEGVSALIAGEPARDYGDQLKAEAGSNVAFAMRYIPNEELGKLADLHQAILVAQTDFLNSGVIFLGLTLGKPVIACKTPATLELQERFGRQWLRLFSPPLTAKSLKEVLGFTPLGLPDLASSDPALVAGEHAALYRELVSDLPKG